MVKKSPDLLTLPVTFGTVSLGVKTARVAITIDRSNIEITDADKTFVDRRIDCTLVLAPKKEAKGQTNFIGDKEHSLVGSADVTRFSVQSDVFSTGFSFRLNEVAEDEITKFRYGSGSLIIREVAEIPANAPKERLDGDREDAKGALFATGDWKKLPVSHIVKGALATSLEEGGLKTMSKLVEYIRSSKSLTAIEGVGKSKAEYVTNRLADFWADNPDAAEDSAK